MILDGIFWITRFISLLFFIMLESDNSALIFQQKWIVNIFSAKAGYLADPRRARTDCRFYERLVITNIVFTEFIATNHP